MLPVGARSPTVVTTAVRKRAPILEQTTLTNKYLLYLSFVNMELGIGRGW